LNNFSSMTLEIKNKVAYISIENPPANALNESTIHELTKCIDNLCENSEVKVIVITGKGKFFVAGADINEFQSYFGNATLAEEKARTAQTLFNKIENLKKPVIAAINGACLGGGLELAMSCHIRVAANEAILGLPELKLGLIPGYGGTQRLARLTNKSKALELILTSNFIHGPEAQTIGLVNFAVPLAEMMPFTQNLVETIAQEKSSIAMAAVLAAVNMGFEGTLEEGLQLEAKLFGSMFTTEDAKEGILSFLEKRKAKFRDC
jgi:enoyl-CoA hydratase